MMTSTIVTSLLMSKFNLPLIPDDPKVVRLALIRGILGGIINILNFTAISFVLLTVACLHIPVSHYSVISALNTSWVIVLSIFLFWTFPSIKIISLVIFSFLGIVLIIDPSLVGLAA